MKQKHSIKPENLMEKERSQHEHGNLIFFGLIVFGIIACICFLIVIKS